MVHRKKGRKLKRTASHRKALLSNLAISLIKYKRIKTTEAKAKELRTYIEPFITKAKIAFLDPDKNVHQRRITASMIKDREAIQILFDEIGQMVKNRPGGYTRVLKTGFRAGDGANEAIIELVDYDVAKLKSAKADAKAEAKESKKKAESKGKTPKEETAEKDMVEAEEKKKSTKSKTKKEPKEKTEKKEKSKIKQSDKAESKPRAPKSKTGKEEKSKVTTKHTGKKKG
ncbi:MAG TPA: 50S ribosomal protein L17 [Ignavibacteria bacterium]